MIARLSCSLAALFLVALLGASPAAAQGALAVGLPKDVAKDGVAMGWVVRGASDAAARAEALELCLKFEGVPPSTLALCKVVSTFHDQCVAVSLDPEPGTPGVGWSTAPNKRQAESQSIAACKATAGSARQAYCTVGLSECDGSAR